MPAPSENIVLLVPGFPENENDSICIPALQQYVFHLRQTYPDLNLSVIAFQYPYAGGNYRWHEIPVYACNGSGSGLLKRMSTWIKAVWYFLKTRKTGRVSLIHSFWLEECALVGQYLSALFKTKHIATIMGQDARPANRYLKHLNFDKMCLTCPSQFAAETFREATGKTVDHIIPIGLDTVHFDNKKISTERDFDILGVGALTQLKNYRLFVNIIAELAAEFPDLRCAIIGDGPEKGILMGLIRKHQLEDHLQLIGELPRPEVIRCMYRSKILLHPSSYESQGYVFMEALYCGMPVVSFPVGSASPSDFFRVCENEETMLTNLRELLNSEAPIEPRLIKSIDETVMEYWQLYH